MANCASESGDVAVCALGHTECYDPSFADCDIPAGDGGMPDGGTDGGQPDADPDAPVDAAAD